MKKARSSRGRTPQCSSGFSERPRNSSSSGSASPARAPRFSSSTPPCLPEAAPTRSPTCSPSSVRWSGWSKSLPDYVGKTRQIGGNHAAGAAGDERGPAAGPAALRRPARSLRLPALRGPGQSRRRPGRGVFHAALAGRSRNCSGPTRTFWREVERLILKAFGQEPPLAAARKKIEHHARLVLNVAVDAKLKAFLLRAADGAIEDTTWLESIATLLAGKPPTHWDDNDRRQIRGPARGDGADLRAFPRAGV